MIDSGEKTICYSTNFDLSLPNGPGTNEQQFVMSMSRLLGDRAVFLLPVPANPLPPGFPKDNCEFYDSSTRSVFTRIATIVRKARALRKIAKNQPIELFVFRLGLFPLAELFLAWTSRARICVKTIGPRTVEVFREKPIWIRVLSPLNRLIMGTVLRKAFVVDVVSDRHKEALCAIYRLRDDQVRVIDNAVDVQRFRPLDKSECRRTMDLPEEGPIVGYVGNLALIRGGAELIHCVADLGRQGTRITALIVAGDQLGIDKLQSLANDLEVGGQVIFRGPVSLDEVTQYIGAMDVTMSIRDDDGCSELKVRQYISCGRPVVVSAIVNEFVVPGGLGSLVDRSQPEQIAAAVKQWIDLVESKDEAEVLSQKLHRYAVDNLDFDSANRERLATWGQA